MPDEPSTPPGGDPPKTDPPEGDKTFTQEEINRIATKEKADGRKSGRAELLKDLGVDSEDDLKSLIEAKRKADDEKLEETERERRARERAESERDQAKKDAAKAALDRKVDRALANAGVPLNVLDSASRLVDLEADADDDTIKAAVEQLKTDLPQLFESAKEETPEEKQERERKEREKQSTGSPDSTPPKPPATGHDGKTPMEQAKELLHKRHPELAAKKS